MANGQKLNTFTICEGNGSSFCEKKARERIECKLRKYESHVEEKCEESMKNFHTTLSVKATRLPTHIRDIKR